VRSKAFHAAAMLSVFTLGTGATTGVAAQQDHAVIGAWEGKLDVGGGNQLTLVFHVERGEDGALAGTMDSPDQGAFGIPLSSVTLTGDTLTLIAAAAGAPTVTGTLSEDGNTLTGTFKQGAASFPLELHRSEDTPSAPLRPQEPKAPYPYEVLEVSIANTEAGIDLAGTLTLPEGDGPFPGVVLVSGSGPQDRNESLLGHKPFWVLADHLTRQGIAVLRYDDRGVAASGGDFATATSEDFASDAIAAVGYLREQSSVAPDRVGIAGHSEGGIVGPMAANESDEVAFVVMLAGPGVPGLDILVEQGKLINEAAGTPPEITEINTRIQTRLAEIVAKEPDAATAEPLLRAAMEAELDKLPAEVKAAAGDALGERAITTTVRQFNSPWFRYFLSYDPRPTLEKLQVPVLALIGEKDLQVPADQNVPEIEAAFARGGNPDATVRRLPGLNHLFQRAETGAPSEYQKIEETFDPTALEAVTSWILERFGNTQGAGTG
jgi:uncharacterized protein